MPAGVFIRPRLRETALFRCLYIPVSDAFLEELDVLPLRGFFCGAGAGSCPKNYFLQILYFWIILLCNLINVFQCLKQIYCIQGVVCLYAIKDVLRVLDHLPSM
jgi:hypothetical protein